MLAKLIRKDTEMSPEHPSVSDPGRHGMPIGESLRVFVADDDADMRGLIATVIRHDGLDVCEFADGLSLLEALRSSTEPPPDLIVSDVEMPRANGLRVLATVKRMRGSIPVVLITAFGSLALHKEARRLGATAVLDKPFRLTELRDVVRVAIAAKDQ